MVALPLVLFLISLARSLKCPDSISHMVETHLIEYETGRCYFLRRLRNTENFGRSDAQVVCQSFNEKPYSWHLPKLDTEAKQLDLDERIKTAYSWNFWVFWLGLLRDPAESEEERIDLVKWGDRSKWRWSVDNKSLAYASWAPASDLAPAAEPNNHAYNMEHDLQKVELCVKAQTNSDESKTEWYDRPCSLEIAELPEKFRDRFLLVCESLADATASTPTITSIDDQSISQATLGKRKIYEQKPETKIDFDWKGILIGLGVLALVSVALLVGVWLFTQHRRKKSLVGVIRKNESNRWSKTKNLYTPTKKLAQYSILSASSINSGKGSTSAKSKGTLRSSGVSNTSGARSSLAKSNGATLGSSLALSKTTGNYYSKIKPTKSIISAPKKK